MVSIPAEDGSHSHQPSLIFTQTIKITPHKQQNKGVHKTTKELCINNKIKQSQP
jgi:hypothetical protein